MAGNLNWPPVGSAFARQYAPWPQNPSSLAAQGPRLPQLSSLMPSPSLLLLGCEVAHNRPAFVPPEDFHEPCFLERREQPRVGRGGGFALARGIERIAFHYRRTLRDGICHSSVQQFEHQPLVAIFT